MTDPVVLFDSWYVGAVRAGAPQPDAMTLATADAGGRPSARMVLFKGVEAGDFLFYTNYDSLKGHDLAANPRAALVFYWSVTRHQVRVFGTVKKLSRAASAAYFNARPRGAQLSAAASRQSRVIRDRGSLEAVVARLEKDHPEDVPLPKDWGGYRLDPAWIEFWENRPDRLHDRVRYVRLEGGGWRTEVLAP